MNFKLNYYDQNNEYLITKTLLSCDNPFSIPLLSHRSYIHLSVSPFIKILLDISV